MINNFKKDTECQPPAVRPKSFSTSEVDVTLCHSLFTPTLDEIHKLRVENALLTKEKERLLEENAKLQQQLDAIKSQKRLSL